MQTALLDQGLHPDLARAVLREVSGIQCSIELDGAGRSEQFPLERGGKQGGVETPDVFNGMVQSLMAPVLASWAQRGFGFDLSDLGEESTVLTHLVWADNILLFATSEGQFATMALGLTHASGDWLLMDSICAGMHALRFLGASWPCGGHYADRAPIFSIVCR